MGLLLFATRASLATRSSASTCLFVLCHHKYHDKWLVSIILHLVLLTIVGNLVHAEASDCRATDHFHHFPINSIWAALHKCIGWLLIAAYPIGNEKCWWFNDNLCTCCSHDSYKQVASIHCFQVSFSVSLSASWLWSVLCTHLFLSSTSTALILYSNLS